MPVPSFLAILLQKGSITKKGEGPDARMIRYETADYPKDVGIELVVTDLEDARLIAEMSEPRLAPWLVEFVINRDLGLATKSSEGAAMLRHLQDDRDHVKLDNKTKVEPLDEINYSRDKSYDGNKNYGTG